jgi:CBS domain-containing protein
MKLKKTHSNFWDIKKNVMVKDVMSREIYSLDQKEKVSKAVELMCKESISSIIIIENKKPIGIITERDLIKKIIFTKQDPEKILISSIMSKNPKKIGPDSTILNASNIMKKLNVRKLVVVNNDGELIGMLSQTDIVKSMNKIYESYKALLWNPTNAFWILIVVLILYLISFILRVYS